MANFNTAIEIILKHEGGLSDHKNDAGGLTNYGLTFELFKVWAESIGLPKTREALKSISITDAKEIYFQAFWMKMKGNDFKNQQLANIVFDGFVNMGNRAIKMLQIELGVPADGVIGDRSLMVINKANAKLLFEVYKYARIKFYNDLVARKPEQKVFLKGWLARIGSFNYQ